MYTYVSSMLPAILIYVYITLIWNAQTSTNSHTHTQVRGYEPGGEDHDFDPRLGNFFLVGKRSEDKQLITFQS